MTSEELKEKTELKRIKTSKELAFMTIRYIQDEMYSRTDIEFVPEYNDVLEEVILEIKLLIKKLTFEKGNE